MSRRPSLKINAISNWTSLAVQIAVGFFLTPFVIKHLGQSGYGVWVLVGSFIGYYGLLNLGVGSAITRYIARFSAQNDTKNLNETANTALAMFCTTGLLATALSFILAGPLAAFFKVAPEHIEEFKRIVVVLGIATGLSFPSGVFSAMITARERYVAINIVNIFATLLRTGLTVVILRAGHGLAGIAYPTLAATLVSIIAFHLLVRAVVPECRFQLSDARWNTFKMLLIYGAYTSIISVADILRFKIDSLIIGKMIGMADVGIFGVAASLIQYMMKLVMVGMGVFTPRFAQLDGSGKEGELQATFLRALSLSSCIACGAALLLILFGRSFIYLWVGETFAAAVPVLTILAVAWVFDLFQNPGIGLMYALNKHRYYAGATIVEAVANVVLSITLAPGYGIIGVALGTALPMIVIRIFLQPVYVARLVHLDLSQYGKAIAPAFGTATGLLICYWLLPRLTGFDATEVGSFVFLALSAGAAGGAYLLLISFFSKSIRNFVLSFLLH